MVRLRAGLALLASLTAAPALAQSTWHVDCRRPAEVTIYEPSVATVEQCVAFFAHVSLNQPVSAQPGHVWTHDGHGWTTSATPTASTPTSTPPPPSSSTPDSTPLRCNPYDAQKLAFAPECESFRSPRATPPAHLDDFRVGAMYREPYWGTVRILMEGVKTTNAAKFWVAECTNATGRCGYVGQTMTLEDRAVFVFEVPKQ